MGETGLLLTGERPATGRLRIIPLGGHSRLEIEAAIQRIEQIWPRLRKNPIRIIRPGSGAGKTQDGQFSVPPAKPDDASGETEQASDTPTPEQADEASRTVPDRTQKISEPEPASGASATAGTTPRAGSAPVVIVTGEGRLTVASDDTEALNQLESLLRTVFSQTGRTRGRDFTIYALRNAGAEEVAETLNSIFQQEQSITTGTVIIVPEERLNALIVFAGRSDRSRLESLIEALDSERTPDSLTASVTRVIPVEHASAVQISSILSGIYKSQMTAGGSRQSVKIPEGVSSDVASVLRQINAAASSPLLTVQTQSETNSLIVKAPVNLLDEVEALIHQLDEATVTRARRVTLIPLRRSSSRRILETLGRIVD
jgi:type II secretory pathway component GspD/PulD (secretin)